MTSEKSADVVICGAGIAGAAAAYHLAVRHRVGRVVLVDEREPLTLTSDKGTQGYRNWWPGPDETMFRYVSRSIDLLEETARESGNVFRMNRRGYLFATAQAGQLATMRTTAESVSAFGMGAVREHTDVASYHPHPAEGFENQPTGADILLGEAARAAFPYLPSTTIGALHVRRAGTINAVALGGWFLQRAAASGATFVRDRAVSIDTTGGRVRRVRLSSGAEISTDRVVIAAGPALPDFARMLDLPIPVVHELHAKVTFHDTRAVIPRDTPFVIWNDPVVLNGELFPGGLHIRPVDLTRGDELYLIWTFDNGLVPYEWPPRFDPAHVRAVIQGFSQVFPGAAAYAAAKGTIDGGYYCKTRENRPLIGPLAVDGAFVLGALSGIGLMSAHAGAELCAAHVVGGNVPDYARAFLPNRYDDPGYNVLVERWGKLVGQL
jgi:glycine/D-amino acid oxidase-like deaminating enzyme